MQNLYKGVQVMSPAGNPVYSYPIFDTFWNNTGLRGTVFENKLDTQKEAAKAEFEGLVTDFNSLIYQFISIK